MKKDNRGGKRTGSGRKKKPKVKKPYIPAKLVEEVREFINHRKSIFKEQKELIK